MAELSLLHQEAMVEPEVDHMVVELVELEVEVEMLEAAEAEPILGETEDMVALVVEALGEQEDTEEDQEWEAELKVQEMDPQEGLQPTTALEAAEAEEEDMEMATQNIQDGVVLEAQDILKYTGLKF